jgi:ATP-dependent protease Clp ATPase subunit
VPDANATAPNKITDLMDLMYDTPSKKDIKEIIIDEDVVNGKGEPKQK